MVEATKNDIVKELYVIEAASNLGLKEPETGKEPGVRRLPDWLKIHGLYEKIKPKTVIKLNAPLYSILLDKESGVRNAEAIAVYSKQLSKEINGVVALGKFPLVIGGDCSILIGCAHALKAKGIYGLFFIDGHTDFVMPHISHTKGAAGMDLAIVTGYGHGKLTNIDNLQPYIQENHVVAFGNRYLQKDYVKTIEASSIAYYDLNTIRELGIENIIQRFLHTMEVEQVDGFWIHLDVDVLDDKFMPCVDSRQPGGLTYDELKMTIKPLLQSKIATGLDITILDPDLDTDGIYTKAFINHLSEIFFIKTRI